MNRSQGTKADSAHLWGKSLVQWLSHYLTTLEGLIWILVTLLPMQLLADNSGPWVLAIHVGDLDWGPASWLWLGSAPAFVGIWRVKQQREDLYVLKIKWKILKSHIYELSSITWVALFICGQRIMNPFFFLSEVVVVGYLFGKDKNWIFVSALLTKK